MYVWPAYVTFSVASPLPPGVSPVQMAVFCLLVKVPSELVVIRHAMAPRLSEFFQVHVTLPVPVLHEAVSVVGNGFGAAVGLGVTTGFGVGVAVGEGLGLGLGLGLGEGVAVGVGVGVAVGVGVGVGTITADGVGPSVEAGVGVAVGLTAAT